MRVFAYLFPAELAEITEYSFQGTRNGISVLLFSGAGCVASSGECLAVSFKLVSFSRISVVSERNIYIFPFNNYQTL